MHAPPGPAPGLFAGRYVIERILGHGATATVHLARDTERGISVAIKILRAELLQSTATERFLREIRRTATLQHPHILPVLDSGEHEGHPYFVLPYMEGGTLRQVIEREKAMELGRVIEIARTIAEALDYAHARGLIHRDVKPENILFTGGQACLGDFGIARAIDLSGASEGTTSTSRNTVRGTPAYMSPEQAAGGRDLDGRSDVYSLACVLYEMVTGMQAFIGPTAESVISQRFAFPPREVRVYRPGMPAAVDGVLQKAFVMTPADRYQTATELVSALEAAFLSARARDTGASAEKPAWRARRVAFVAAAGVVVTMMVAAGVATPVWRTFLASDVPVDTTRLVLLPLERSSPAVPAWRDDDLLQQAFARWRDIKLLDQFQIADGMQRRQVRSNEDAAALARSLGAARYVRGRVTPLGAGWRVSASLYDVSREQPLYQASMNIPNLIAAAASAYAGLADSLLLRGAAADSLPVSAVGSRSLPAVQAFGRAQLALDDWDLEHADSLFQAAVLFDPDYARANLWLAQVRAWQNKSRNSWGTLAERAATIVEPLNYRERLLVRGLILLAKGSHDSACAVYDTLARRNDRDFAAWYGLGQCRNANRLVYADPHSPSGWSFRSSAHRAMQAYERAFTILPSVHRGYERGAFNQLRVTLRTTTSVMIGYGVADSARFSARPGWVSDTLALIPYPWQLVASADPRTMPPNFAVAMEKRREAFKRIAASWSAAYPRSAAAKYAVAIALETLGDPTAIDTLRLARRLTADDSRRRQYAATQVILMVKFGLPARPELLQEATLLADSLLSASRGVSGADADVLTHVAMLVGRCDAAERLARSGEIPTPETLRPALFTESQALLARVGTGCRASKARVTVLTREIDREFSTAFVDTRSLMFDQWVARILLLSPDTHPEALAIVGATSQDPLLRGLQALAAGRRDSARQLLRESLRPPRDTLTLPTPDIAFQKARLGLAIGDTASAITRLDATLAATGRFDPGILSEYMRAGSLLRCVILRADVAAARGDAATARRWGSAAAILLEKADAELKPDRDRMKSYNRLPPS